MFARTSKALERLNKMFLEKQVQKTYWAVVKECPEKLEDTLVHFLLKKQEKNRSSVLYKPRKGAKLAELSYRLNCYVAKNTIFWKYILKPAGIIKYEHN